MTMEITDLKFLLLVPLFAMLGMQTYGQDVSDILNQITSEKEAKKQTNVNSTVFQPAKTPEPTEKRAQAVEKTDISQSQVKKTTDQPNSSPGDAQAPRIVIYRAKDKLPKNVAGAGVAGDFLITGEDALGGATIIAAEDASNTFARIFIIKNASSGHPPGTVLPNDSRCSITVPAQKPLIFIGRGMIPGEYQVRAQ